MKILAKKPPIQMTQSRLRPLAKKFAASRLIIRLLDRPIWMRIPAVSFKIRGRMITHRLAFGINGSQEKNPEALLLGCMHLLKIRSFWDVGADIGYHSWIVLSASPKLEVVLLEPLLKNSGLIRDTLKRNGFSNTKLIVAGASNKAGEGILRADVEAGAKPNSLKIPLIAIDDERIHYGPIDFMKIDVEGREGSVLRGAVNTISSDQPILFIKCRHPEHACLAPLKHHGYTFVDADRLSLQCDTGTFNFYCFPPRFSDSVNRLLSFARNITESHYYSM